MKLLEAEVTKKDMMIKNTKLTHTKNSRSLMNNALKIEKRQKNYSNQPLSDEINDQSLPAEPSSHTHQP
jgi:hypothetical protein